MFESHAMKIDTYESDSTSSGRCDTLFPIMRPRHRGSWEENGLEIVVVLDAQHLCQRISVRVFLFCLVSLYHEEGLCKLRPSSQTFSL